MALDPSIPLQVRPIQLPDPVQGYARVLQMQNLQMQNEQQQRQYRMDMDTEAAIREAGGDLGKAGQLLMSRGLYKPAMAIDTQRRAQEKATLEGENLRGQIAGRKAPGAVQEALVALKDPSDATILGIYERYRDVPGVVGLTQQLVSTPDLEQRRALITQALLAMPGGREALQALQQKVEFKDTGGALTPVNVNPLAGPVGQAQGVQPLTKTATPDAMMTDSRTRAEGAANRSVTMRGQDLVNARSRESNAISGANLDVTRTTNLRKEFDDTPEVKNYRSVVPIINSAMKVPDTRAGDIQFAYTIGKIFDPNSVVREGELKLVGEAATVLERFKGELRTLTEGKGRLTPQTRQELLATAMTRVNELKNSHDAVKQTFERAAQGLPQDQIFADVTHAAPAAQAAAREFRTVSEAAKAGLKDGDRVIIGGRPGTWRQ